MSRQEPRLDLTKIRFPSDRITVQSLREIFPPLFDREDGRVEFFDDTQDNELQIMLEMERRIARREFHAALGKPWDQVEDKFTPPEQDKKWLTELYITHRLATGPHHAEQLIRAIEQAAAEQTRSSGVAPPTP